MRRAREELSEEARSSKRQATLATFFTARDGTPLAGPRFAVNESRLQCPYCDFVLKSEFEASLAGNMKNHCVSKHTVEVVEASARVDGALRFVRESLFDFQPLEPIAEVDVEVHEEDRSVDTPSKPKVLRHSYTTKQKYYVLKDYEKAEAMLKARLNDGDALFAVSVLELVSRTSGIPISTIKDWRKDREKTFSSYLARRDRLKKRFGSGRHALFPKSESKVAEIVRDRRKGGKLVSKALILKHLKLEAEKENREAFANCQWSAEMVSNFMRRNGFSLRYPSCTRMDNLEESILICRAFHRGQLAIFADTGEKKYAVRELDPQYGRYRLKYRFNGDEVPYRFGRIKSVVSLSGESATHVTWPPGWEARLATMYLLMDGEGRIAVLVLIFSGAFERSTKRRLAEIAQLERKAPHIKVLFQKKAWMDGQVLASITKKFFLPYLRDLWASDGVTFAESYLQLDNGPGRCDEKFLKCLKEECKTYLDKSPPEKTNYIQLIDDNCGRTIRGLACDCMETKVVEMDPETLKHLTSAQKRELMVEAAEDAYVKWMDPTNDHFRDLGRRAALRTGLAMRVDNNCEGVRPVRFPEGYSATIPASSGAPVKAYFVESSQPSVPSTHLEIPPDQSELRVDLTLEPNGAVQLGVHGNGSITVTRQFSPAQRFQEEVGMLDGWSDEEERVFLVDEVDHSESESEDQDETLPRRHSVRRRWCLMGCDCERQRGRKCICERRGDGHCSDKCGCDVTQCRARLSPESEDSDS